MNRKTFIQHCYAAMLFLGHYQCSKYKILSPFLKDITIYPTGKK